MEQIQALGLKSKRTGLASFGGSAMNLSTRTSRKVWDAGVACGITVPAQMGSSSGVRRTCRFVYALGEADALLNHGLHEGESLEGALERS